MTVLRCSRKLLTRMRRPAVDPEPVHDNPLGPWYADIDFIDRQPFVLVMNAATSLTLVLPGRAASLRRLHEIAATQLMGMLDLWQLRTPLGQAEFESWLDEPVLVRNTDRSLVASMNQRKYEAWTQFAYNPLSPFEVALRITDTPFRRKDLGKEARWPLDLLRARLSPPAVVLPFPRRAASD